MRQSHFALPGFGSSESNLCIGRGAQSHHWCPLAAGCGQGTAVSEKRQRLRSDRSGGRHDARCSPRGELHLEAWDALFSATSTSSTSIILAVVVLLLLLVTVSGSISISISIIIIIIIIIIVDIDIDLRCNPLPLLDAFNLVDVPQKNHVQLIRGMGSCWCTTPFTKLASKRFRPPLARTPHWWSSSTRPSPPQIYLIGSFCYAGGGQFLRPGARDGVIFALQVQSPEFLIVSHFESKCPPIY